MTYHSVWSVPEFRVFGALQDKVSNQFQAHCCIKCIKWRFLKIIHWRCTPLDIVLKLNPQCVGISFAPISIFNQSCSRQMVKRNAALNRFLPENAASKPEKKAPGSRKWTVAPQFWLDRVISGLILCPFIRKIFGNRPQIFRTADSASLAVLSAQF